MTKIGLGIVGVGVAALSAHIPAALESDDFDLLAICDLDPRRLEYAQGQWRIPFATSALDDFFAFSGLQAVIVSTPPNSHFEIARKGLAGKKHLLVEKPLAPTHEECEELVKIAAREKSCLLVGYEKRFHPTFEKVCSLLQSGAIGRPFYGGVHWASNVKLNPKVLIPEGFRPGYEWRWRDPAVGGGIVQDHLPHYVDLIRYWLKTEPSAVYAQTINVACDLLGWERSQSIWEDMGLVVVRFSNGFLLRFETGTAGRSLSPVWSLGSGVGEWTEYGYILGTDGSLLFDLLPWDSSENGRIAVWNLQRATEQGLGWSYVEQLEPARRHGSPSGAAHAMFRGQLREFGIAISGGASRAATSSEGLQDILTVECAYRSALEKRECEVILQAVAPAVGKGQS
jgi:predicted dehydrogenase